MSAASPSAPRGPEAVVATLVLDTSASSRALGLRDAESGDRRLLYSAPGAHIELRMPPAAASGGDVPWLYGQFVPVRGGGAPGVLARVTLRGEGGAEATVDAGEAGDFAMPCDPTRPFTLRCEHASLAPVLVRYAP